jgi:hypothetical protein
MTAATALGFGVGSIAAGVLIGTFGARSLFNGQVAILLTCGIAGWLFVVRPTRTASR